MPPFARRLALPVLVLLCVLQAGGPASIAEAAQASPYTRGSQGYDISYPQGAGPYPAQPYAFGIVGVTGGRAASQNAYLAQQFTWAKAGTGAPPALYMNLNAPIGRSATQERTSTPRTCKGGDKACQGYNYGWHVAQEAVADAASQGASASLWWLDVETANSWLQADVNIATINGATAGLRAAGVGTVGIYSTPAMWTSITGGYTGGGWPTWQSGPTSCPPAGALGFAGGQLWLVQHFVGGFDVDIAC